MDGRPKLNVVLVATLVVLAAGSTTCAQCIPAGPGEGASITNQFAFDAEYDGWRMWNLPDPGYAHHVSYDPPAGPWINVLELPNEVISGTEYKLSENVKICPSNPNVALWTGWHTEIVTEGWTWSGEASIEMIGGIPGGHGFYGGQIDGDVLEFDFGSAVDSDAFLSLWMKLVYDADGQGLPAPDGPIVLHQYALVPEPSIPGDIFPVPGDGIVDGDDLGVLLANWGESTVATPGTGADLYGDNGNVDGDDLGVLLANWTGPALVMGAGVSVPEPSTVTLLCMGALGLLVIARRKRRRGSTI